MAKAWSMADRKKMMTHNAPDKLSNLMKSVTHTRPRSGMGSGWHFESRRHSLAAQGISTAGTSPKMPMAFPKQDTSLFAMSKLGQAKNVTIIGRRWFDKQWGNTYHSVDVYVDGKNIGSTPFEYGYDDAYIETAFKLMQEKGYAPKTDRRFSSGMREDSYEFRQDMRNHRDKYVTSVSDVARKKDL